MGSRAGLEVDYHPLAEREPARWEDVLGIATFDNTPVALHAADIPVAQVRTPVLGTSSNVCEIWRTRRRVESGQRARVRYRRDDNVLFGCIALAEADVLPLIREADRPALHAATEQAYREIFAVLDAVGYGHLLRVWNYVPQINVDTHGTERYRQFNSARRDALKACGRDVTGSVPAACALGSMTGSPLVIYFLASRAAPTAIENPRQISAYHYPPQYGPQPAFSRASVLHQAAGAMLFISGTASIVGHQTIHVGDAGAQTRETLANIEALLSEANRVAGAASFALGTLAYKVYVRHATDLGAVEAQLRSAVGSSARVVYLKADICRQDLLVEIEATGSPSLDGDA
jgi:enamine deaminase RidA (YjgF/YER057c/UK114 family)